MGLEESFRCTSQEFDVQLTLERHLILEILSLRQPNLNHSINRSAPMISASGVSCAQFADPLNLFLQERRQPRM